jgi:putative NADH-flavin reductase
MNLTVLGATGSTGTQLVEQALAAGHHVTALARSPEKLTITNPNLSTSSKATQPTARRSPRP